MNEKGSFPSLVQLEFRRAKTICKRKVSVVQRVSDNSKSSAQVATLVRPQVVSPKSGGLKPGRKRPYRLMGRFSKEERDRVKSKAMAARVSVNEFIRLSAMGADYASSLNPELRQLFLAVHRELCRQGNNLNQVAKHLNAGTATCEQGDSMLAMISRSLITAHMAVGRALAEGREMP